MCLVELGYIVMVVLKLYLYRRSQSITFTSTSNVQWLLLTEPTVHGTAIVIADPDYVYYTTPSDVQVYKFAGTSQNEYY